MTCTRWLLLVIPACLLLASCQSGPVVQSTQGRPVGPSEAASSSKVAAPITNASVATPSVGLQRESDQRQTAQNPTTRNQAPHDDTDPHPRVQRESVSRQTMAAGNTAASKETSRTLSDWPDHEATDHMESPIQLVAYGSHVPRSRRVGMQPPEAWMCQPTDIYGSWDNWRPPGIQGPWPADEYICDGGDRLLPVSVDRDWTVRGIDQEDTIAHYDTLAGKTIVQPSNRVCIYAPRFAAVRHVSGVLLDEGSQWAAGVTLPVPPVSQEVREEAGGVMQPVQLERSVAVTPPYAFLDRLPVMGVDNVRALQGINFQVLPHEDLLTLDPITWDASQKARIAEKTIAAKIWETATGLQVVIDHQVAVEAVRDTETQEVVTYDMPKGKPRLEIIKIASKQNALPGDLVEFTLRYENVGTEEIGNVTIIDSLTTRLEYVEDSAQSSRDADFFAVENEGESLLLRWELKEPLKTGEGGLIRFQTRVR